MEAGTATRPPTSSTATPTSVVASLAPCPAIRRGRPSFLESVAHPGLGEQVDRARRVVFELAPQLRQIHPQIMGFLGVGGSPDFLEQFLAADEFPPVAHHPP